MANQQPNHNFTNGGDNVHDGVFLCEACDNRLFPSYMDLLRHQLSRHGQQPVVQAPVAPPPPPPPLVENGEVTEDESSEDDRSESESILSKVRF